MLSKKAIAGGMGTLAVVGGSSAAVHLSQDGDSDNENFATPIKSAVKRRDKKVLRRDPMTFPEARKELRRRNKSIYKSVERGGVGMDTMAVKEEMNLENRVGEIKRSEDCIRGGWEWKNGRCTVPKEITKDAVLEAKSLPYKGMDECVKNGGNWQWNRAECKTGGIILRESFPKSIYDWDKVEDGHVASKFGAYTHLYPFNSGGYWEIRKNESDYIAIFKRDKLSEDNEEWDFPNHYNFNGWQLNMNVACEILKRVAGDTRNDGRELYLYNEGKNTFWNCKRGGFVIVAY